MKEHLNKNNDYAIKEYLGLESDFFDKEYREMKADIDKAIDIAIAHNAGYILESDFGIYANGEIIENVNGIIVFKEKEE